MTYQEIIYQLSNDTVDFISSEVSKFKLDAGIVMEMISKTILEINYNSAIKSLNTIRTNIPCPTPQEAVEE
jgi:hypothetical protein